jgi:DNA-damage-inducible protein D
VISPKWLKGRENANRTHREVGAKIRKTIAELGGTMPEELPVAEDIKRIETKQKKALKDQRKPTEGSHE